MTRKQKIIIAGSILALGVLSILLINAPSIAGFFLDQIDIPKYEGKINANHLQSLENFPCCYSNIYQRGDPSPKEFKEAIFQEDSFFCQQIKIRNHRIYCLALTKDPYYCRRINPLSSWLFHEINSKECWQEASRAWQPKIQN